MLKTYLLSLLPLAFLAVGCSGSGGIEAFNQQNFPSLLTMQEVLREVPNDAPLELGFIDVKAAAAQADPRQVVRMDSAYSLGYLTSDGESAITLGAIDYTSNKTAMDNFDKVMEDERGLELMDIVIGDVSASAELESGDTGGIVVFVKGDKLVQIHITRPEGGKALTDLAGLVNMARIVERKLK